MKRLSTSLVIAFGGVLLGGATAYAQTQPMVSPEQETAPAPQHQSTRAVPRAPAMQPQVAQDLVAQAAVLDIVETSDGSRWQGVLVEQVPGQFYRLALLGGSVKVLQFDEVVRVSRAPKIASTNTSAASSTSSSAGPMFATPPLGSSGARLSVTTGIALPNGDVDDGLDESLHLILRAGYERYFGNLALYYGARLGYINWANDGEDLWFHTFMPQAELRGGIAVGVVTPYVGLSAGPEIHHVSATGFDGGEESETNVGFGMDFNFGADLAISKNAYLGLAFDWHPGTTKIVDVSEAPNVSFFGINAFLGLML